MKLLIVDDQPGVTEGLCHGVNWAQLGFSQVQAVNSVREARAAMLNTVPDVMLCDIEMPEETGLELFKWVKKQGFATRCIFLTAHAKFSYAQEAMHLGAFDYIIQPAPYSEISQVTARAVKDVQASRDQKELTQMGRAFNEQAQAITAQAIRAFLSRQHNERDVKTLQGLGIFPRSDRNGYLVLIHILRWEPTADHWEKQLLAVALNNIAAETFAVHSELSPIASVDEHSYAMLLQNTAGEEMDLEGIMRQRPMFASFDGVFNTILFTVLAIVVANIANKYADVGNYTSTQFFHEFWMMTAIMSAIFTVIAVISIAPKDRPEFFGTGKPIKVGLKDYWDTLKNNRAIQMLVLSASTDKLGSTAKTSAVAVAMFACIAGSIKLQGSVTAVTTIPSVILTFLVISIVATRFGQKKAMVIGSIGGIICNVILSALWIVGDPTTMTSNPETGALNWGPFLITYVVFSILYAGCQGISGNIVIPMTADCADYEVYRSGKYVPGLMGTLFSFVDKMISSFAPMIAGLVFAACGFTDHNPSVGDIVTPQLRVGVVFLAYGLITIGLICNLIAMKFYPLSKEKMAEIQDEIVKIKAKAMAEA